MLCFDMCMTMYISIKRNIFSNRPFLNSQETVTPRQCLHANLLWQHYNLAPSLNFMLLFLTTRA